MRPTMGHSNGDGEGAARDGLGHGAQVVGNPRTKANGQQMDSERTANGQRMGGARSGTGPRCECGGGLATSVEKQEQDIRSYPTHGDPTLVLWLQQHSTTLNHTRFCPLCPPTRAHTRALAVAVALFLRPRRPRHPCHPPTHSLAWHLAVTVAALPRATTPSRPAMATLATDQPTTAAAAQSISQPAETTQASHDAALSSSPVEMRTLQSAGAPAPPTTAVQPAETLDSTPAEPSAPDVAEPKADETIQPAATSSKVAPPAQLARADTQAIGPSTDTPAANPDNSNGPVLVIMLLLTTGARHPYKIDERYLKKRNVIVDDMDPYNISVYTLKELIWRDWREGTLVMCAYFPPIP